MLVLQDRRLLIVPPSATLPLSKIKGVIPHTTTFRFRGHQLAAVPHTEDVTKVLRNLGLNAPHPIQHYYDWPARFSPFPEQRTTSAVLASERRAYCLSGMGVGKTISTLWAYDFLRTEGLAQCMLVVAPLSTLERTWGDHVFEHFPHLEARVLHGAARRRKQLLDSPADVYIVNHHGLATIASELAKRPDIDLVVYDELAVCRNAKTQLWKSANAVINQQLNGTRRAWGLTGTPIPNEPTDAWAQCKLITPTRVPRYFGAFRDSVMKQVSQFRWVSRPDALEKVYQLLQPSVRFSLDDCTDLPEQIFLERDAPLTPAQQKAYKAMMDDLRLQAAEGRVLAVNEAVKAGKLLQIACGVAYTEGGGEALIPVEHRLAALHELVDESEASVIVFVPFTAAIKLVAEYCRRHWSCEIIDGGVSKRNRDETFKAFQQGSIKVLVAQPATMSHGLTLTAASTIIWYAPINSNETFEQANARIRRPGQTRSTVVACLTGTPIERKMFDRLKKKQSVQGALLDLFRNQNKE